jgi:EmrB/QacA subfamily drug resistance transporter
VFVLMLGSVMPWLDTTVTNVALNTLRHDLHGSVAGVQWVVTGYMLSVAATIPVSGWAARRFGARPLYLFALVLFAASSGLCALSNSLIALVAFRVLQGVGGGVITPVSQLIAAEVAGPLRTSRAISRIWMVGSIGAMMGLVLGGAIIQGPGWRWIFLINLPIGVVSFVAAKRLLPATPSRPAGRLDIVGFALLSLGVPTILFGFSRAEAAGSIVTAGALGPLVVGAILVLAFIRHAHGNAEPLLDLRLYNRRPFLAGSVALASVNAVWFGFLILLPLYFQQIRLATPLTTGLLIVPQSLGGAAGLLLAGRIRDPRVSRISGLVGVIGVTAAFLLVAQVGLGGPEGVISATLPVASFASSFAWTSAFAACYASLLPGEISHASPLVAVISRLGAAIGSALTAMTLQGQLNGAPATSTHLLAAYRSTFMWLAAGGLVAVACFVFLVRTHWVHAETHEVAPVEAAPVEGVVS